MLDRRIGVRDRFATLLALQRGPFIIRREAVRHGTECRGDDRCTAYDQREQRVASLRPRVVLMRLRRLMMGLIHLALPFGVSHARYVAPDIDCARADGCDDRLELVFRRAEHVGPVGELAGLIEMDQFSWGRKD